MAQAKTKTKAVLTSAQPVVLVGGGGSIVPSVMEALAGAGLKMAAADSGADALKHAGITPELVAGDFDSISSTGNFPHSKVIEVADQDRTDFEKTLALIDAPLVIGLGFLGRRLDHALAALDTLARVERPVVLLGEHDVVFFARGSVRLELERGARLSVWPMGVQGFRESQGLEWPLHGLTLKAGEVTGTSNRVSAPDGICTITPQPGGDGFIVLVEPGYMNAVARCIAPDCAAAIPQLPLVP